MDFVTNQEMYWDGHRVVEALRETGAIRVTFLCGAVASIPVPVPSDAERRKKAVLTCAACVKESL